MGTKRDYIDWVWDYLDDELSEDQLKEFHKELETNKELQADLDVQQNIMNVLKDTDKINFYNLMIRSERRVKNRQRATNVTKVLSVILIIFSIWFVNDEYFSSMTNNEIYAEYYKPYNAVNLRGINENKSLYEQGIKFYNEKEFSQAIDLFSQIPENAKLFISEEFYTALSFMELQKFSEAINHFEKIVEDKESVFHENINWYLALCYIKTNQIEKAKSVLQSLDSVYYKEHVDKVLKEIEQR